LPFADQNCQHNVQFIQQVSNGDIDMVFHAFKNKPIDVLRQVGNKSRGYISPIDRVTWQ